MWAINRANSQPTPPAAHPAPEPPAGWKYGPNTRPPLFCAALRHGLPSRMRVGGYFHVRRQGVDGMRAHKESRREGAIQSPRTAPGRVFSVAKARSAQNPSFIAEVVGEAAAQKSWQKVKPPLGWPRETDSLCPPCVREARQAILDGKRVVIGASQREGRRNQGHHPRARRQDPDGQGLPLHGHFEDVMAIDTGVLQAPRGPVPGPRHPLPQRREAAQPRRQHHQVRPRLGAHGRPDQPLQHDVRPVLHGREPGRVRPRAGVGRHQDAARQRHLDQAAAPDVGAVLGRRAHAVAVLPRRRPLRHARSATTACRRRPTASSSRRARSSPRPRPKPVCATPTCSSTASATPPTRTACVGNLFDVKLRAIENLLEQAGVDIVPVTTIVNGVNNEQVGRIDQFALDNPQQDRLPVVPAGVVHRP